MLATLHDVPLFHEEVEHSRRARGAPEQKKPGTEAFRAVCQNDPHMLRQRWDASDPRAVITALPFGFTCGKYDTMRPKQMKVERAVVNQS